MDKFQKKPIRIRSTSSVWISLFIFIAVASLLPACTEAEKDIIADNSSGFAMPQALQRATFPTDNSVAAFITIDGGSQQAMTINGNRASFNTVISEGKHELLLEMLYQSTIPLVMASKTIEVSGSVGNAINFSEKDYIYTDSDGDSWTNVREIEAESDPFDVDSVPVDFDDNYEDNDSRGTAYDVTGLGGAGFISTLSTGQGYVTEEDRFDYYTIELSSAQSFLSSEFILTPGVNGSMFYVDSAGDLVFSGIEQVDSGDPEIEQIIRTFTNPQPRTYFLFIFLDEGVLDGGYNMRWSSVEEVEIVIVPE